MSTATIAATAPPTDGTSPASAAIDRIPTETLDQILSCLTIHQIYRCLTVSQFWYQVAIARLYSFSPGAVLARQDLFDLFYQHRHHIRHAAWNCSPPFQDRVREIRTLLVLDSRQHQEGNEWIASSMGMKSTASTTVTNSNSSAVKTLFFEGKLMDHMMPRFYETLSMLPSLTRLDLQFTEVHVAPAFLNQPNPMGMAGDPALAMDLATTTAQETIEIWTLLNVLPNLEYLTLLGCKYAPLPGTEKAKKSPATPPMATDAVATTSTESGVAYTEAETKAAAALTVLEIIPKRTYKLKSFHFQQILFATLDPIRLLAQFPCLDELGIHSSRYFRHVIGTSYYDPITFARGLRHHCSKITHLVVEDWLPICLSLPTIAAASTGAAATAKPGTVIQGLPYEDRDLFDYQGESTLEPILPKLTTLECPRGILTAEDFELCYRLEHLVEIDVSDARENEQVLPFVINRWRGRPQTKIQGYHLQTVLERCSKLKDFRATNRTIHWDQMALHAGEDENGEVGSSGEPVQYQTRPWACESTLEYLSIGFMVPTADRRAHRAIWSHLGRLRRLEDLQLILTNLIPSLEHGMGSLARLPRLKRYTAARSCWSFPDKETALWIAQECKTLEKWHQNCQRSKEMVKESREWFESIGKGKLWVTKL
ncbi:hypothetical protein BGZ83_008548 [Gryganskiella cystojenkinii]|nr:hypothetical protein BGZ83_008548 [Gryganskiella cystojenkinii]